MKATIPFVLAVLAVSEVFAEKLAKVCRYSKETVLFVYDEKDHGVEGTDWWDLEKTVARIDGAFDIVNSDSIPVMPWMAGTRTVYFDTYFYQYKPRSTALWFSGGSSLENIWYPSSVDCAEVTDMHGMFAGCSRLGAFNLGDFCARGESYENPRKVRNLAKLFAGCTSLRRVNLAMLENPVLTNMKGMFQGCTALTEIDFDGFGTAGVTDASRLFDGCSSLEELDLSGVDFRRLRDASAMFRGCGKLRRIGVSRDFSLPQDAVADAMFGGCSALGGSEGTPFGSGHTDGAYARVDGGTARPGYLSPPPRKVKLVPFDGGNQVRLVYDDVEYGRHGTDWFGEGTHGADNVVKWYDPMGNATNAVIDASIADYRPKSLFWWFSSSRLQRIVNLGYLDTSAVTNMVNVFHGSYRLGSLDLSHFDTSNVTDMRGMFSQCRRLRDVDVSGFDTSRVRDMSNMFCDCEGLEELELSSFDTAEVANFDMMFNHCTGLKHIYVSDRFVIDEDGRWRCAQGEVLASDEKGRVVLTRFTNEVLVVDLSGGIAAPLTARRIRNVDLARLIDSTSDVRTNQLTFLKVPAGSYPIGHSSRSYNPPRTIGTSGYHILLSPVTQGQYLNVTGQNPAYFRNDTRLLELARPVESVSAADIDFFLYMLNIRTYEALTGEQVRGFALPTGAQWEIAARAGGTGKYPGGNEIDPGCTWYEENSSGHTWSTLLANRRQNAWGLCDVVGNVFEVCRDRYSAAVDADSLGDTEYLTLRGGSYGSRAVECETSVKVAWDDPGEGSSRIGFRPVFKAEYSPFYAIRYLPGDGASGNMGATFCEPGRVYRLAPPAFTPPEGKSFKGWYSLTLKKRFDDGALVFDLADPGKVATLYGIWE